MIHVTLKRGKEKPVLQGHPWLFSGSIAHVDGAAAPGESCIIRSQDGSVLGHGYYNPHTSLRVRLLTAGNEPFTEDMLRNRMIAAIERRKRIEGTDVIRLINSEGDFLPGLVIDRYGEGVCMQILTAGMAHYRQMVVDCIRDALSPRFIYERSEGEGVEREGMTPKNELVSGTLSAPCIVVENGIRFAVDLKGGQKTGFFIDQRENRVLVRRYAAGAEVADCFSYSGGFSLAALAGGAARVRSVDVSKSALALAKRNREENGFAAPDEDFIAADVFAWLREASRNFTLMVLDPPKFARHPAQRDRAARGYKDINLLALRLLRREGMLFTFSCSQAIDPRLFRQIVFGAAVDAQREVQVLHTMGQPEDHPVNIAHREGEYLTGLVLRVVGDR